MLNFHVIPFMITLYEYKFFINLHFSHEEAEVLEVLVSTNTSFWILIHTERSSTLLSKSKLHETPSGGNSGVRT